MTPINKGIGVLALSLLSGVALAQNPVEVEIQTLNSDISVVNFVVDGSIEATQQIASPFGIPKLLEGDAILYQGLYGVLTKNASINTSGISDIFDDNADYAMVFDASVKTLGVKIPAGEKTEIFIVDMAGKLVMSQKVNSQVNTIDLSNLAPGVYMAGASSNNKFSKTLKFILK